MKFRLGFFWLLVVGICGVSTPCKSGYAEGLVEITSYQASDRERVFLFDIVPVSRCMFGDYDLLLNDLQNSHNTLSLKLTVESLGGAKSVVAHGEPLEQKTDEKNVGTYRVKLPLPGKSGMFGVYLCSVGLDQAEDVPCSQQEMSAFNESFAPYHVDSKHLGGSNVTAKPYRDPKTVNPKLYYAQFLAMNNYKVATFQHAPNKNNAEILKLFGVDIRELGDIIDETKLATAELNSLPLATKDGRLQILLPFFDEKRCNHQD